MEIVERIFFFMKEKNINQKDFAEKIGLPEYTISNWNCGRSKSFMKMLPQIANVFGISQAELLGEAEDAPRRDTVRINVLGIVPAGIPIEAIEDVVGWEEIPRSMCDGGKQYFALRVRGDSMWPDFLDGDNVIVRKESTCTSGDVCVVYTGDRTATLKQVKLNDDGSVTLQPKNQNYAPRTFSASEVSAIPVSIAGVVVELRRKI